MKIDKNLQCRGRCKPTGLQTEQVKKMNSDRSHESYKVYKIKNIANTDPLTHQEWY